MYKRVFFLLVICINFGYSQSYELSGTIQSKTGEKVFGATIIDLYKGASDVTNDVGFFKMWLSEGFYSFQVQHVGYESDSFSIYISGDTNLLFSLRSIVLPEIKVSASKEIFSNHREEGSSNISETILEKVPLIFGSADPIKALGVLPGVTSSLEGSANIVVRGGEPDQNLLLLDNLEIVQKQHLFGFHSSINGDFVSSITLYNNYFPPEYGGKLSAIIQAKSRDAVGSDPLFKYSVGIVNSSFFRKIPKRNHAIQFGVRASYPGLLFSPRTDGDAGTRRETRVFFIDGNFKYQTQLNPKTNVELLIYNSINSYSQLEESNTSLAQSRTKDVVQMNIFNVSGALEIDHQSSEYFKIQNTSYSNLLKTRFKFESNPINEFVASQRLIEDHFFYQVGNKFKILFAKGKIRQELGIQNELVFIRPQQINTYGVYDIEIPENPTSEVQIHSIFEELSIKVNEIIFLAGLRIPYYKYNNYNFITYEPRLGLELNFPTTNIGFWITRNTQFFHSINSLNDVIPIDYLLPSTDNYLPQSMWQFSSKVSFKFENEDNKIFSINPFIRNYKDLSQLRPGQQNILFNLEENWTNFLVSGGEGKSWGAELSYNWTSTKMGGNLSYTYTNSDRIFPTVNAGRTFNANFERPHDIKINLQMNYKYGWSAFLSGRYASGGLTTLPEGFFLTLDDDIIPIYTEKNNHRLPNYQAINIGIEKTWESANKKNKKLQFGVSNLLGRKNYIAAHFSDLFRTQGIRSLYGAYYHFRFLPSLNYTVSW